MNTKNSWNITMQLISNMIKTTYVILKIIYRQTFYVLFGTILIGGWRCCRTTRQIEIENLESNKHGVNQSHDSFIKNTDEKVSFSLNNSFIVLTDIIDSTRLFNQNKLMMRHYVSLHYKMIISLIRKYNGHIVSNEGDSFNIAFQSARLAIDFSKEFLKSHQETIQFFQVRIGIVKGKLNVRKFSGYKVFGKVIDEALDFFQHNDGTKICVKKCFVEKYNCRGDEKYCVH